MSATTNLLIFFFFLTFVVATLVFGDDADPIPADKSAVNGWFTRNVIPLSRGSSFLVPQLVTAERSSFIIRVRADGTGHYKHITDAIRSIPNGNTRRVIISIGPGTYREKVTVDKPFVTLYGDARERPTIVFGATANSSRGTMNSATVLVNAKFFSAVYVTFQNSAPRPTGKKGQQAVALAINDEFGSFYGCRFIGFQDTLYDNYGRHFFMGCYIEGTVDFVFGHGTSLYLDSELHVVPGDNVAYVTAQAREVATPDHSGYSFVHCRITGSGGIAYLGRPWRAYSTVVFAYSELTNVVNPRGWSFIFGVANHSATAFFGEYLDFGPGSAFGGRAPQTRRLSDATAGPFIRLGRIMGSKWLLPPLHLP